MAKAKEAEYQDSPTAWFFMLETSLDKGDFDRAGKAVRELKRLGVTVKWRGRIGKKIAEAERVLKERKATALQKKTAVNIKSRLKICERLITSRTAL